MGKELVVDDEIFFSDMKDKKKPKPSYDFSRLANIFSNPDLVEDTAKSKKSSISNSSSSDFSDILNEAKTVKGTFRFQTPYSINNSNNIVEAPSSPSASCTSTSPASYISSSLTTEESPAVSRKIDKNLPRGKCPNWLHCKQCSRTVNCGVCQHCLDKTLR